MNSTTPLQTMSAASPASAVAVSQSTVPGAGLARFFETRGRHIVEACGSLWYSAPNGFLMPVPYHLLYNPEPAELRNLLVSTGFTGARFPSRVWGGIPGGFYVRRGRQYDLHSIHIKHRPRVKHGLEVFQVRPVEEDELIRQGVELNRQTMHRQRRHDPEFDQQDPWTRFVKAMRNCPEIGALGAFRGGRLAAFMITCREDGWLHVLHQMSRAEDLPDFPNHALTFHITSEAAADPSLEGICYGLVPLVEIEGLHEYKLRFGYEVVAANCAVSLHPSKSRLLDNRAARIGVAAARMIAPRNQRLEMIQTVLRGAHLTASTTAFR